MEANYKQGVDNPVCPICKVEPDTQNHLMVCEDLNLNLVTTKDVPEYVDLFNSNLDDQVTVVKLLRENLKKRTKLLKKETTAIQLP